MRIPVQIFAINLPVYKVFLITVLHTFLKYYQTNSPHKQFITYIGHLTKVMISIFLDILGSNIE